MNSTIVSKLARLKTVFRSEGLKTTLFKIYVIFINHLFEIRYGIETSKWAQLTELSIDSVNKERGVIYQPTSVMPLRKLFRVIKPIIPSDRVFVDFGCGKGRVLLVASEFGFRKVKGVEFAHELCEIARENCANFKAHKGFNTEYQIIECDVCNYAINTDENVFFMFNPFDETILNIVLCNIVASLKTKQRKILIIYYNPKYGYAIEHCNDFSRLQDYNFWGYKFTVYSNLE